MEENIKYCCILGSQHLDQYDLTVEDLKDELMETIDEGCRDFIIVKYGVFDKMAMDILSQLACNDCPIHIDYYFSDLPLNDLIELKNGFSRARKRGKPYKFFDEYAELSSAWVMQNESLFARSYKLIAYADLSKSESIAARSVLFAREHGLEIVNLYRGRGKVDCVFEEAYRKYEGIPSTLLMLK